MFLPATSFVGNITGDVTGNVTGNVTGDLIIGTKILPQLKLRTIHGVSFTEPVTSTCLRLFRTMSVINVL